jgi:hypothetical protein
MPRLGQGACPGANYYLSDNWHTHTAQSHTDLHTRTEIWDSQGSEVIDCGLVYSTPEFQTDAQPPSLLWRWPSPNDVRNQKTTIDKVNCLYPLKKHETQKVFIYTEEREVQFKIIWY